MRQSLIRYEVEGVGSVEFAKTPPRFLNKFDGSSVGSSAISYKAIGLHGEKDGGIKLEPRTISAEVTIVGMDSAGKYSREKLVELKNEIFRVINPLNSGKLVRVNQRSIYEIDCRVREIPAFTKTVGMYQTAKLDFYAPYPLWRSTTPRKYNIGNTSEVKVYNDLGIPAPIEISGTIPANASFTFKNLTSGTMIKTGQPFPFERKFRLNTATCEIECSNIEGIMVPANFIFSFNSDVDMVFEIGENLLKLESTDSGVELSLTMQELYIGVD